MLSRCILHQCVLQLHTYIYAAGTGRRCHIEAHIARTPLLSRRHSASAAVAHSVGLRHMAHACAGVVKGNTSKFPQQQCCICITSVAEEPRGHNLSWHAALHTSTNSLTYSTHANSLRILALESDQTAQHCALMALLCHPNGC